MRAHLGWAGKEMSVIRKEGGYGWTPSPSSNFLIRVARACPLVEIRQTVPC